MYNSNLTTREDFLEDLYEDKYIHEFGKVYHKLSEADKALTRKMIDLFLTKQEKPAEYIMTGKSFCVVRKQTELFFADVPEEMEQKDSPAQWQNCSIISIDLVSWRDFVYTQPDKAQWKKDMGQNVDTPYTQNVDYEVVDESVTEASFRIPNVSLLGR